MQRQSTDHDKRLNIPFLIPGEAAVGHAWLDEDGHILDAPLEGAIRVARVDAKGKLASRLIAGYA